MTMSIKTTAFIAATMLAAIWPARMAAQTNSDENLKQVKSVTTTTVTTTTETRIVKLPESEEAKADTMRADGKLIWVPDSLVDEVRVLVKGHSRVVDDPLRLDLNEEVVFRGDTIPMVLKMKNFGRYDRGLFNMLFIPTATWNFGLTASYGEFSTSDMAMLSLIDDVDVSAKQFSIKPYIAYFIRNNLCVGARFNYTNGRGNIDSFKVDIDEDMKFNLQDIGYRAESYATSVFVRQYVGLTRRGRFGVSNEVELEFSSGNSDFNRPYNGAIKRTHTTNMEARLTFSPGVCVFIMENVSFNLSFGAFGFYIRNERQTVDGENLGNRFTSGANFKIDLFNLSFGIGIHI